MPQHDKEKMINLKNGIVRIWDTFTQKELLKKMGPEHTLVAVAGKGCSVCDSFGLFNVEGEGESDGVVYRCETCLTRFDSEGIPVGSPLIDACFNLDMAHVERYFGRWEDTLAGIERKLEWLKVLLFRQKHKYNDEDILYHGWIRAFPEQRGLLRALGVKGEMVYNEKYFEHCICGKATIEALMLGFPAFWPGCFTAYVGEQQLPRILQVYWRYPNTCILNEAVVDGKWKCPRCDAIMKVETLQCGNCMAYRTYLETDRP